VNAEAKRFSNMMGSTNSLLLAIVGIEQKEQRTTANCHKEVDSQLKI